MNKLYHGQTNLLDSYTTKRFPSEYVTTVCSFDTIVIPAVNIPFKVFDNYLVSVTIGEDPYSLGLFNTAGEHCHSVSRYMLIEKTPQDRRISIGFVHYLMRRRTSSYFALT